MTQGFHGTAVFLGRTTALPGLPPSPHEVSFRRCRFPIRTSLCFGPLGITPSTLECTEQFFRIEVFTVSTRHSSVHFVQPTVFVKNELVVVHVRVLTRRRV
jgi:hypothetical protein